MTVPENNVYKLTLYATGKNMDLYLLVFVCVLTGVKGALDREVYEYSSCKGAYQKEVGVSDGRIPDSALTASSFNAKRQPQDGRVGRSAGAWSPAIQNAFQWLQVDLGKEYVITQVLVQGRQGSDEYVREFFLEYSDDAQTWRRYTNSLGISEMFEGNIDDSSLQRRTLTYPIVARYVRFNPQRWNMVISMRVEIVGCEFEPETASFDGTSYIEFDMSRQAVQTTQDLIEMRFRTSKPDGVIMYASGNQGDLMMLEMSRGYLYFRIDLGSTPTARGLTEVKAGSLLDDNQWHDVVITRDRHTLRVVVDRLINEVQTNGLFYRLDLDKYMYVGGVPYFNQEGITVKYNFFGCVQNLNLNGAKMIRDAMNEQIATISIINNVNPACNVVADVPVTFPTLESYIRAPGTSGNVIQVSFEFRTHDRDSLLVYHQMSDDEDAKVVVQIDENGQIKYTINTLDGQVVEDIVRNTDLMNELGTFTDGLWHSFSLKIDSEKINCTVDRNVKVSSRRLSIQARTEFFIGGHELFSGFRGCMRKIYVAQAMVKLSELESARVLSAQIGTCAIRDRCTPNPCEHQGVCEQTWSTFTCDCDGTGYEGALCHTSAYHLSCEMHKYYSNVEGKEEAMIDPDGSGPLEPFKASCERDDQAKIITYIGHDSMGAIRVNGYQNPGSYVRKIQYAAKSILELEEVIDRSDSCRQSVLYRCSNARFLVNPGEINDPNIRAWGWWVGRTFQPMYYWGGAAPGSGKCKCGLEEEGCGGGSSTCYCDKVNQQGGSVVSVDQGYLEHKEYLPVLELHLGDTGSTTDDKWSEHDIGELECFGDNLFDNTVTFYLKDGALEFPTFEAENAGDIWFQFKTTTTDGVMIHCAGSAEVSDFIEIRLFQSDTVQFRYDVGNGVSVVSFKSPSPLNDDTWHTVHVEKNRKQAWMRIDDYTGTVVNEDADLIRQLDLNSALHVGSLVGYQEGYVGCMRGLRVNGRLMDMVGKVRNSEVEVHGVRLGCIGKCASSPCFNGGTCREGYDRYTCDCSYTPWRGWNCGREVGVNLKSNYMIQYMFDENQGLSASDFQRATIGFSTKVKQGILMQMRNEANTEYITVEMNNNGGVKIAMDVGFERVEVNTPSVLGIDYANSQVHVVVIERSNYGRDISIQVDNYPPGRLPVGEASSASDTILDNPKYLFIGNNDTTNSQRGFEGCIYRMQVDNIFPLKRAFQDPKPDYITLVPNDKVREDMCGFEEITVSAEPIRKRQNTGVLQNITYTRTEQEALSETEKALVGIGCALFIILLVCIILFCCRTRFEGADYETEEAKGAEYADNPDSAVVYNQTGLPNMPKSYEYFM